MRNGPFPVISHPFESGTTPVLRSEHGVLVTRTVTACLTCVLYRGECHSPRQSPRIETDAYLKQAVHPREGCWRFDTTSIPSLHTVMSSFVCALSDLRLIYVTASLAQGAETSTAVHTVTPLDIERRARKTKRTKGLTREYRDDLGTPERFDFEEHSGNSGTCPHRFLSSTARRHSDHTRLHERKQSFCCTCPFCFPKGSTSITLRLETIVCPRCMPQHPLEECVSRHNVLSRSHTTVRPQCSCGSLYALMCSLNSSNTCNALPD